MRQTNPEAYIKIVVDGFPCILDEDTECTGIMNPLRSPLLFNVILEDSGDGTAAFSVSYRIVGDYEANCLPEFGFDLSFLGNGKIASLRPIPGEKGFLRSFSFPLHYIQEDDKDNVIIAEGEVDKLVLIAVPALLNTEGAISFNVEGTNKFLRQQAFRLKIHEDDLSEQFKKDASFIKRMDLTGGGLGTSFESVQFRNGFVRHRSFKLRLEQSTETKIFKEDATWIWESYFPDASPSVYLRLHHKAFQVLLQYR